MKVVFVRDEKRSIDKCHVCGNVDYSDKWVFRYVIFGSGYNGYEEECNACSDDCWSKIKDLDQKELRKLYIKNK